MLQPACFITLQCHQKISGRGIWFKSRAILFSGCSRHIIPFSPSSGTSTLVVLTLKQASRSCLGRRRTSHSSETSPWTNHPDTSQWPGTSHLCGAPAHHSSEACKHTELGSCGEKSYKKKAHSWHQTMLVPLQLQPHRAESEQKLLRNGG